MLLHHCACVETQMLKKIYTSKNLPLLESCLNSICVWLFWTFPQHDVSFDFFSQSNLNISSAQLLIGGKKQAGQSTNGTQHTAHHVA